MGTRLPIVDLNTNTVAWGDKATKLTPVGAELMSIFVRKFPGLATRSALISLVWGGNPPEDKTLDVHMCKLRREIAPLGLSFRTQHRSQLDNSTGGYVLVLA